MGLTKSSTGVSAVAADLSIQKHEPGDAVIALAGNPNVGKSTVFNALTGMNQHTGNWPGKTVACAQGFCQVNERSYVLVDIPGTYSLLAHSAEEEVARNFICFGSPDAVVVVCDATCLERNLNLVLQTLEITSNAVVCVNLLDEARHKGIKLDLPMLSRRLGVPVVGTVARKKKSLASLMTALDKVVSGSAPVSPISINYPAEIETELAALEPLSKAVCGEKLSSRWLSLKLLEGDDSLIAQAEEYLQCDLCTGKLAQAAELSRQRLRQQGIDGDSLRDMIVSALVSAAETVCRGTVTYEKRAYDKTDRRLDRILTSRLTGYPIMLLLLAFIFWLTIVGANYPSALIADLLFRVQDLLTALFTRLNAPAWLHGMLVLGVYRVLAWVVSVMLPPMAIFFPLFTLLEDAGYLPRIAYNLDKPFKRCCACGKQSLTMCMGFGCNAAGIVGCRIIDSPRERLLAILTNCFVPCNGRFPALIAILTMFFVASSGSSSLLCALLLTGIIVFSVAVTLGVTKLLSNTILKGVPSSFTLELPPYRRPQIGKVIVRSIFDRTLFVLGRAVCVAAPAGMLIWLMANLTVGGASILSLCAGFLDPFARLMGLDGVILIAFVLGFPANEIVIPIIVMAYMSNGSITELSSLVQMKELFLANGWTWVTAASTIIFFMMHWPCSTTLITIHKETGSAKWTALAAAIPTLTGIMTCILFTAVAKLLS